MLGGRKDYDKDMEYDEESDSPMLMGQCSCGGYMGMLVNPADDTDGNPDGCYCKYNIKPGMLGGRKDYDDKDMEYDDESDSPMLMGQCSCGGYMGMLVNPADDTDGNPDGCYCKYNIQPGMLGGRKDYDDKDMEYDEESDSPMLVGQCYCE